MAKFEESLTPMFGSKAAIRADEHDSDKIRSQFPELYGEIKRAPYTEEDVRQYEIQHRTPRTQEVTDTETVAQRRNQNVIIERILNDGTPAPVQKKKDPGYLN